MISIYLFTFQSCVSFVLLCFPLALLCFVRLRVATKLLPLFAPPLVYRCACCFTPLSPGSPGNRCWLGGWLNFNKSINRNVMCWPQYEYMHTYVRSCVVRSHFFVVVFAFDCLSIECQFVFYFRFHCLVVNYSMILFVNACVYMYMDVSVVSLWTNVVFIYWLFLS